MRVSGNAPSDCLRKQDVFGELETFPDMMSVVI